MQTEVASLWEQNVTFILEAEELGVPLSLSPPLKLLFSSVLGQPNPLEPCENTS